jgi:DNA-binding NarL/FixJ family response regulator
MNAKTNVLIVAESESLRNALTAQLIPAEDIHIIDASASNKALGSPISSQKTDVVLIESCLDEGTAPDVIRQIAYQSHHTRSIFISSAANQRIISLGIQYGIDGWLPSNVGGAMLIDAIHTVERGEKYYAEAIRSLIYSEYSLAQRTSPVKTAEKKDGLTKREMEILRIVANGNTNAEVAAALSISLKTVEAHKASIREKLGLKNTAALVKYAIKNNIITVE